LKVQQDFRRTGAWDELLLGEMMKQKLSSWLFQLPIRRHRPANQAHMLSTYCLWGPLDIWERSEGHKRETQAITTKNLRK